VKFAIKFIAVVSIIVSTASFAGVKDLTWHSRANCGNNESITWHAGHVYTLLTVSDHLFNGKIVHRLASGWENTWRSANVHWFEAKPGSGWFVQGGHYRRIGNQEIRLGFTTAKDCNIYDGWWD
jgi:hypothetical protein